jgi:ribose 5-phosphate isomerase B
MRIALGSDHAGYEEPQPYYKPAMREMLAQARHEVIDCGTDGPDSVDYPDFAERVCKKVLSGEADRGILLCGTGIGMSISANRHPGIRAAVCTTPEMAELARTHNHANVLCLGRRILSLEDCAVLIHTFLKTPFSEAERHARRVAKMG